MKTKITFLFLLVSMFCLRLSAAPVTWIGPVTGDWATAANWSTTVVPGSTDDVTIPVTFTVTVSTQAGIINSLSVGGKLLISATGNLSVEQTTSLDPIVGIAGGEIENVGTFKIKQTIASNNNIAIRFGDNVDTDSKFTNKGTFTVDLSARSSSSTSNSIQFSQTSANRMSRFVFGGTMNFILLPGARVFALGTGGLGELGGTYVLGSPALPLNFRFIQMGSAGTISIAPTANLTIYAEYTNTTNGFISMASPTAGTSFINNGILTIHGGPNSGSYGIYYNPSALAPCKVSNSGKLTIDGTFPLGAIYVGGNSTGINTLENLSTGVMTLTNADPAVQLIKTGLVNTPLTFNNDGLINVSTANFTYTSTAVVFTSNGIVKYNYLAGIKPVSEFKGKVYSDGQYIVVSLSANESAKLVLTDITGKTIQTATVQGEKSMIQTNNLKGIFIVRLLMETGSYSQKVVL